MRACLLFLTIIPQLCQAAISILPANDFTTGNDGWQTGGVNPNPPVLVGSGGASGTQVDPYLLLRSNGTNGAGGRLVVFHRGDPWAGDYVMKGIAGVEAAFLNVSNVSLDIRVALNGAGGRFATTDSLTLLPNAPWTLGTFRLQPNALVSVGGTDLAATLGAVTEIRFLHHPQPEFVSVVSLASLGIDRIRAIPEPSTASFLILGLLLVRMRCRVA